MGAGNAALSSSPPPSGRTLDRAGGQAGDLLSSVRGRVEPHVRHLVAEHLGMSPDELVPTVSLTGEVAADSRYDRKVWMRD
jgi:hypothetical protein